MAQPWHPSQSPVVFLRVQSFHLRFLFLFINDLHKSSDVQSFSSDSTLCKYSSFLSQSSSNVRSQSRLVISSTINLDLQSIFEWGAYDLVRINTSKAQLLTIFQSNNYFNYLLFENSETLPLNSVSSLEVQISIPPACLG